MPIVTNDNPQALLSGNSWNGIDTPAAPIIVTFSFPTTLPDDDASIGGFTAQTVANYTAFTTAEQAQALTALGEWAAASGITFVQVAAGQGDINFGNVPFSTTTTDSVNGDYQNAGGIGFYPYGYRDNFAPSLFQDDLTAAGDIFMNSADQSLTDGTVSLPTLVHEIGHAIGLKHPTQTVKDPLNVMHDDVLSADDPTLTIMASSGDSGGATAASLKTLDIAAAQALYGSPGAGLGVVTGAASGSNSLVNWSWDPGTQTLTQTANTTGSETIHGTSVDDIIIGNNGGDTLIGLGGNDSIVGGTGNDTIFSGSGNDTLVGGGGIDTFYVRASTDTVIQQAGGSGSVYASVSYTAPANITYLQVYGQGLTATANDQGDRLYGDGGYATTLIGGAGNDTIVGGAGADTMVGGGGNDEFFVFNPAATITEQAGGSGSVIATFSYTAGANIHYVEVHGKGLTATANDDGDSLFGDGTDAVTLIGGAGNDYIAGGTGNDTIIGGGGFDTLFGGGGDNTFVFKSVSDAAPSNSFQTYIGDFQSGSDKIDLSAISGTGGAPLRFGAASSFSGQPGQIIDVANGTNASFLEIDTNGDGAADFALGVYGSPAVQASDLILQAACYAAGTRIATEQGEAPIETLRAGDLVRTASGALRPVRWLGHRRIDTTRHPDPVQVWPFLVEAGAFAEGVPTRDLWLSPGHNVVIGEALVGICRLGNGRTIRQVDVPHVEYWHVELDAHDIVLAEGLAAESYLDTGNRFAFANGGAFIEAHPDFSPVSPAPTCLPLVEDGPLVHETKSALLARIIEGGATLTHDEDLHGLADGVRIEPVRLGERRRAVLFPPGAGCVALRSRFFVPQHVDPQSTDGRVLGFCTRRLQLDGDEVPLNDAAVFGESWHQLEINPDGSQHRWSSANVSLPTGTRLAVLDLCGAGQYWLERPPLSLVLAG